MIISRHVTRPRFNDFALMVRRSIAISGVPMWKGYEGRMNTLVLALVVSLLPALVVAAEQQKPKKPENSSTLRPTNGNPCAQYGPGFVQLAGSTTCVKVGGGVTFEGGRR
jgi:hypothetical protein